MEADGKQPKVKLIHRYPENNVYDVYMPDGNRFRYSWGKMVVYSTNKEFYPKEESE